MKAMQVETEQRDILERSLELRVPVFKEETPPREKISALESYMLLSAFIQGDLSQERAREEELLSDLEEKWADEQTTTQILGKTAKSEASLDRERRDENPDLWRRLKQKRRRVRTLSEEIARMERDAKVCSRAYTFITGS